MLTLREIALFELAEAELSPSADTLDDGGERETEHSTWHVGLRAWEDRYDEESRA